MKTMAKLFVLVIAGLFVLTLIQGCDQQAATGKEKIVPPADNELAMKAQPEKQCPKTVKTIATKKLSQDDIKKARLVSAENMELKSQLEQLQKNNDDLNAKLTKAQQDVEQLKKNNEQAMELMLSSMAAGIEEQTTKLQEENKQLKAELEQLKKGLNK